MNQREKVLQFMREHPETGITAIDAMERFNIMRIGARIWELKHLDGYRIDTITDKSRFGTYYARYILRGEPDA